MRARLTPWAMAALLALTGVVAPVWGVWAAGDPFRGAQNAIQDVRDLLQDFQKAVNDTQRFARQAQRDMETVLKTLQKGQIKLDRLDKLIKDLDKAVIELDNARSEFANLDDVRRQIEPIGDLAVKVVDLANQGVISNVQSNAIMRSLDQIATQLSRIDEDTNDVDDRLRDAGQELDRAVNDLESILDNADVIDSTETVSADDLVDPIESLQRAITDLKLVDRRTQRLKDRIREIDRRLTRINSDLRSRSSRNTTTATGFNHALGSLETLGVFDLAGRPAVHSTLASDLVKEIRLGAARGVYLVVQRVRTEEGVRLEVKKLVIGR